ncbi:MAG TPA: ribonuclease D [Methylococcaceae bacterium]|nr:ribonuclease D [Methylococcaceae bacterium]
MQTLFIDTPDRLREFCQAISGSPWLAVDTEFLRERTYYPEFCLLQVANDRIAACIDPLALADLTPILDVLYDPAILKVFHAGRQDLEIFFQLRGSLPLPLFDTQLAAPLLGYQEQIGYGGLVAEMLGVTLSKAHSRTDWSKRPLSPEQLDYAVDDVVLLGQLYPALRGQLESLGRLDWLDEDFRALADPALYRNDPENAWQRVSGIYKLNGKTLAVAQELAIWREIVAKRDNLPRGWIFKDDTLLDLARLRPATPEQLGSLRGLGERTVKRSGGELCRLIADAAAKPPIPLFRQPAPPRPTLEQEAVLDALQAVVRLRAVQNRLNPSSVASRKDLEWLLLEKTGGELREGWRHHLVGQELEELLEGEGGIKFSRKTLQVENLRRSQYR